jgi:DNA-directed RNA polymerase subunit beta'
MAQDVKGGQIVATWDPHTHPIIIETAGRAKFIDMEDGITVRHQTDELTGLTNIENYGSQGSTGGGQGSAPCVSSGG